MMQNCFKKTQQHHSMADYVGEKDFLRIRKVKSYDNNNNNRWITD